MQIYELGQAGYLYLDSLLKSGDHLGYALFREPLENGQLITYLPDVVDPSTLSLKDGALSKTPSGEDIDAPIRRLIVNHLPRLQSVFVMELKSLEPRTAIRNLYSDCAFRWFTFRPSHHRTVTPDGRQIANLIGVYGLLAHEDRAEDRIRDLLDNRRPFGATGVLSFLPTVELPRHGEDCDPAVFTTLAANTQYILGDAYDGDGWIVWSRDRFPKSDRIHGKIF